MIMRKVFFLFCPALVLFLTMNGCGSKSNLVASENAENVVAPATPGSLDDLVNTAWLFEKFGAVIVFGEPPACQMSNPKNPSQSAPAYWSLRENGVLTLTLVGTTKAGTWDGKVVVLSGETGTKQN